jgi:hypothetical protein
MPDLRTLSRGTQVLLAAAILLLIVSFFRWWEVDLGPISVGESAWGDFWGVVMGLLTIVIIAWVGAQVFGVNLPELPAPERTITLALGASIFVFALLKNLINEESTFWSYIGVILAAGVAVGAWLRSQEPAVAAASVSTTPPAPPPPATPPPTTPPTTSPPPPESPPTTTQTP